MCRESENIRQGAGGLKINSDHYWQFDEKESFWAVNILKLTNLQLLSQQFASANRYPSAYPKIPKWRRKNPGECFN
jgi:hypothetical protein